jgi:hypothetical protein
MGSAALLRLSAAGDDEWLAGLAPAPPPRDLPATWRPLWAGGAAAGLDLTATRRPDGKAAAAGDTDALRLRAPGGEGGGSSEPAEEDSDDTEGSTPKNTRSLSAVGGRGAVEPPGIGTTGTRGGEGGGRRRSGGRGGVRDHPGGRLAGEGGGQHQRAPEGGGGARSPQGGAAELTDMTSMPTPKATSAVLIGEDEEALGEMAASILQVDETG